MSAPEFLSPTAAHRCVECGHHALDVDKHGRCAVCEFFAEDSTGEPRPTHVNPSPPLDQAAFDQAVEAFHRAYRDGLASQHIRDEQAHTEATEEALEAFLCSYQDRATPAVSCRACGEWVFAHEERDPAFRLGSRLVLAVDGHRRCVDCRMVGELAS